MLENKSARRAHVIGLSFISFLGMYLLAAPTSFAAGTIYLSPASKTVSPGTTLTVGVRENSGGDKVNAVEAHLSYPADKIDFLSYSGGSAFPIEAPSSGGGGTVSLSRGVIGAGVSGDNLIANVSFRVKSGVTGGIAINVTSGSLVRGSDQVNVYGGGSGANYTSIIPTPAPTAVPTPTPTLPPSTPPTISAITVTPISYQSATVNWKTDRPASSIVTYGLNTKYGLTNTNDTQTTDHKVVLDSAILTPGTTYHFQVKSIDQWGNQAVSKDSTFQTTGYTLILTLRDDQGNPLANTSITLIGPDGSKKATTDVNGKVAFQGVAPGPQNLITNSPGAQALSLNVTDKPSQSYSLKVAGISTNNQSQLSTWLPAILAGLCILLPLIFFALIRLVQWLKKRRQPPTSPPANPLPASDPSPSPITHQSDAAASPETVSPALPALPDSATQTSLSPSQADEPATTPVQSSSSVDKIAPLADRQDEQSAEGFLAQPEIPFDPTEPQVPSGLAIDPLDDTDRVRPSNQHDQIESLSKYVEEKS